MTEQTFWAYMIGLALLIVIGLFFLIRALCKGDKDDYIYRDNYTIDDFYHLPLGDY